MAEKLCLQWNNYKENIKTSLGSLRDAPDFTDVTLACEDGKQIEAHRIILACLSPFFGELLRRNRSSHPLIYLRGFKSEDMTAVVDFLYRGEANVLQDNLDSFLAIAQELQLEGLTGESKNCDKIEDKAESIPLETRKMGAFAKEESKQFFPSAASTQRLHNDYDKNAGTVAEESHFSVDVSDIDNQCNSLMLKTSERAHGKAVYECKVCGKKEIKGNLRKHIEANHLEAVLVPCPKCEKIFRSKNSKAVHMSRDHKKSY